MKNSKLVVVALAVTTFVNLAKSQDPTVMTINDKPIKKSEFEAVYRKNNGKEASANTKSVKEYVDLFSTFKMKVFEAEANGLDTNNSFKISGYLQASINRPLLCVPLSICFLWGSHCTGSLMDAPTKERT